MHKRRQKILLAALAAVVTLYVFNASWRVSPPEAGSLRLIAHRGVHQTYHREGLKNDTCTAQRIYPPVHDYIENTVRSMQAAFAAGADIVELDVHPTTDGRFAVMHDWTLNCRTEGKGETRSHGFYYKPDDDNAGMVGLPIIGGGQSASRQLRHNSAAVLFLRNQSLRLSELGALDSRGTANANDGCRASCVDW